MQASETLLNGPIRDDDVAISKNGSNRTAGTRRYFDLVEQYFDEYNSLTPKHHPRKGQIVADIFRQLSARFVHKNGEKWFILNEKESLDKIKQRFCDERRAKRRREVAALRSRSAGIGIDPLPGILDSLLSPPTNMATTTAGANEAAASRGDSLMSPNDVAATTNDANEPSDESYKRRSHTPPFNPAPTQMGTTGGNFLGQRHAPSQTLMSTGGNLPTSGDDFPAQRHASTLALMSNGGTLPTSGDDFLGQGHAPSQTLTDTGGTLPTSGDDFLSQGNASAPNPTNTGDVPSLPTLEEAAAQWDDLLRTADDHISEFDDIHQYAV